MGLGMVNKRLPTAPNSKFQTFFGVDKRALALFRICIGLIGLYDYMERWVDIKAHYSDEGILPRSTVSDGFWNKSWFSFHMMTGAVEGIQFLFIINIIVCIFLTIGYRTRLNMFLYYLFVISIQARNNIVGHGGDVYLRVICFFGIFLPLGSVFSIDSAFKKPILRRKNKRFSLVNFVSFAAICQVIFLYVFSYLHKTGEEWRVDYTASFYALNLDYFRTFLVDYIIDYSNFLKFMTFSVLYYEGFGSCLFFSPIFTAPIRTFGALGFTMLHIGFGAFLRLGIFSPTCAAGTIFIYPSWFWDQCFNYLRTRERTDFKIYYSGRHGYNITALVSTFLLLPDVEISPTPIYIDEETFIQTNNGLSNILSSNGASFNNDNDGEDESLLLPSIPTTTTTSQLSNWIITRDLKGNKYTGYKAMVSICKASPILWPLVKVLEYPRVTKYGKIVLNILEKTIVKVSDDIFVFKPSQPNLLTEQQQQTLLLKEQKLKKQQSASIGCGNVLSSESNSDNESLSSSNGDGQHLLNYQQSNDENYNLLKTEEQQQIEKQQEVDNCIYHRKLNRKKKILKLSRGLLFNSLAIMGIIFALGWNCNTTTCNIPFTLPPSINWAVFLTRMDQMWSMFSPRPPAQHWWYTFEGVLDDGTKVELWNNEGLFTWKPNVEPYTLEKPNPYPSCIGNHRWFKVYENLNSGGNYETVRMGLARWVCREYNTRYQDHERLHTFNIVFRLEKQNLDNTRSPLPEQVLWQHVCYNKPPQ